MYFNFCAEDVTAESFKAELTKLAAKKTSLLEFVMSNPADSTGSGYFSEILEIEAAQRVLTVAVGECGPEADEMSASDFRAAVLGLAVEQMLFWTVDSPNSADPVLRATYELTRNGWAALARQLDQLDD